MNKRLLTDREIAKPTTDEERALYASVSEMELGRQGVKTLKAVGEAMAEINKMCDGDAQYYNAMRHFEGDLKQGRMPE